MKVVMKICVILQTVASLVMFTFTAILGGLLWTTGVDCGRVVSVIIFAFLIFTFADFYRKEITKRQLFELVKKHPHEKIES